jgi:site-specific recombinase XerD
MTSLIDTPTKSLFNLVEKARGYAERSKSQNTIRAYRSDWMRFEQWCKSKNITSLPAFPETVAVFLANEAETCKVSTLARRMTAISEAHKLAGFSSPCEDERVKAVLKGIRRTKGASRSEKKPLLTDDFRHVLLSMPNTLQSVRDRALILLGFVGAFRRSELVALNRDDLTVVKEGILVRLKRSKTDQEGIGTLKAIPYGSEPALCPVRAILAWIEVSNSITEPLFVSIGKGGRLHDVRLSDKAVSLIIKRILQVSGLDAGEYSGHSLRAGFATQAALNGASDRAIMQQTKHKSRAMVDRYVRVASIWSDNGATKLGL